MAYEHYPLVSEQNLVPYHDAFSQTGEESAQTQSAVLLGIGAQLRGRDTSPGHATTAVENATPLPEEDWEDLAVPRNLLDLHTHRGARFDRSLLEPEFGMAAMEMLRGARDFRDPDAEQSFIETQSNLSENFARSTEADPEAAAKLVENSLNHPQALVRVAAASAGYDLFSAETPRNEMLTEILAGLDNEDSLVRELSNTVLARIDPDHPRLVQLTQEPDQVPPGESEHTSLLVHGTWARHNSWWQPGGDFHRYILDNVFADLYSQPDRYDWSGGWSDQARTLGASQLEDWVTAHSLSGLNLICHSHGGNVAMAASHASLQLNKLVLLSCPAHPGKYLPNFNQVNDVVSVRVKLDLVILADGGGQRFRINGIRENRLPIWFNHSASHDPAVWQTHNVPALL